MVDGFPVERRKASKMAKKVKKAAIKELHGAVRSPNMVGNEHLFKMVEKKTKKKDAK